MRAENPILHPKDTRSVSSLNCTVLFINILASFSDRKFGECYPSPYSNRQYCYITSMDVDEQHNIELLSMMTSNHTESIGINTCPQLG